MNAEMQKSLDAVVTKIMGLTAPIIAINEEEYTADQQLVVDYFLSAGMKKVDINIMKLSAMYRRLMSVKQQMAEIAGCKTMADLMMCCKKQEVRDEIQIVPV